MEKIAVSASFAAWNHSIRSPPKRIHSFATCMSCSQYVVVNWSFPMPVETEMEVSSAPTSPMRIPRTGEALGHSTSRWPRTVSPGA
ncbi:MAG: hypothetical protein HY293_13920 [Planctomycetes bacterium]|nr:hypothetical protein [Planctomycetota bacterium]